MIIIDRSKYYKILDEQHYCCSETQFRYQCNNCDEYMGCYFCEFDCDSAHDCDIIES